MQTNNATDAHITVSGNQCYGTHGISIGSETTYGLESILVDHNTINGRDSSGTESSIAAGMRVKSYAGAGGKVTDVKYVDTTMRSLQYPIDIDPFYDPPTGTSAPYFAGVEIDGATETGSVPGAESVLKGYTAAFPLGLTLRDVHFDTTATVSQYAAITEDRLEPEDLRPRGDGHPQAGQPGRSPPEPAGSSFPRGRRTRCAGRTAACR